MIYFEVMTDIIDALQCEFSEDQLILSPDSNYCEDYSQLPAQTPKCVVKVNQAVEVQTVLKLANQYRTLVTTRGGGSGKAGGSIPEENGIVLSLENMKKIIDIDLVNRTVTVEPGVLVADLQVAVESNNLWYPVDPASLKICTIGGNVACNAGGPRALKYGVTGDYVLGMQGFYGDGTPFQFGGKLYKDVAGYDLKRLMIGSEGTLGLITTITLKLLSIPQQERLYWFSFDTLETGVDYLVQLLQQNYQPSAAEFMPRICMKAVEKYQGKSYSFSDHAAHLLLAFDSVEEPDFSISPHVVAVSQEDQAELWQIRRDMSLALSHISRNKCSEDITVPVSKLAELMRGLRRLSDQTGYLCLGYGHLGDGNVHVNILNVDKSDEEWQQDKDIIVGKIIKLGVDLGGTLTGEHGVGLTKKAYMDLYFTARDLEIMKGIKAQCDPNGILNPSKII
mgnify:CR=1 FL=1